MKKTISCPSSSMRPGAGLLGLVQNDASVTFLGEPLVIDEQFIQIASQGAPVGRRFRFSGPCLESGCGQWSSGEQRCGVAASVKLYPIRRVGDRPVEALPNCGIRETCRWFRQEGASVCSACPAVIHEGRPVGLALDDEEATAP